MKLSVAIITYNEAFNIKRTLEAIHDFVDEVVIVDSNSTDDTKLISTKYSKVRFYSEDWKGDGLQKQSVINKCKGEWILLIDADEVVSDKLKTVIKDIVYKNNNQFNVYKVRMVSYVLNKPIHFGGWSATTKRILFKKNSGHIKEKYVHAYWETTQSIGHIKAPINHYTYKNLEDHVAKMNSYTTNIAKSNADTKKRISLFKVFFAPIFQFVKMYIFRLGFLDGFRGFYLAIFCYFYFFLKYYKLYNENKRREYNTIL